MFLKQTILGGLLLILILSLGGIGSRIPERQSLEMIQNQAQLLSVPILSVPRVRHALSRVRKGIRRRIRRFVPPAVRSQLRHNLAELLHGDAFATPRGRGPIPPDGSDPREETIRVRN